jgi:hypothetical protein
VCPSVKYFNYCTRAESGGAGFAWAFVEDPVDAGTGMGTLFLRVVNFVYYNKSQRNRATTFEFEGMELYDSIDALSFKVEATCEGCDVAYTHDGVDYYAVDDYDVTCPLADIADGVCDGELGVGWRVCGGSGEVFALREGPRIGPC